MAIQGIQNLTKITINPGAGAGNDTAERAGEYNAFDGVELTGYQQGGNVYFGTVYSNNYYITGTGTVIISGTGSVVNTYITTGVTGAIINNNVYNVSGGQYLITGLVSGNVASGVYNRSVLETAFSLYPASTMILPVGIYYISGALNSGILATKTNFRMESYSPDVSFQQHEQSPSPDKRATTLVFQMPNTGDIAMYFALSGININNAFGPFVFRNLRIEVPTGSAIQIGRPDAYSDGGGGTTSMQTRGVMFDGVNIALGLQHYSNSIMIGPTNSKRFNRSLPETFGIRLYGPYDLVIRDCVVRGGWYGIDLYEADFPHLNNIHYGHQVIAARHTTRPGFQSVGGVFNEQFVENNGLCCFMLDRGSIINSRVELGYGTPLGAHNVYSGVTWTIGAGSGSILLAGLTGSDTCRDLFQERMPISVVDSVSNRKYWFQVTGMTSNTLLFRNSNTTSYVNRALSGSVMTRYFGTSMVLDQDTTVVNISAAFNETVSNTPIGFHIPVNNRTSIIGFTPNGIGNFSTGNQFRVIGHCRGPQFLVPMGTSWFDSNNILAPVDSPLADIYGMGVYDPNGCSYINSTESSVNGRKWVAVNGQGTLAANNEALKIELTSHQNRKVEDWTNNGGLRSVKLIGLEPSNSINFKYSLRARNQGSSSAFVNVSSHNLNVTNQTVSTNVHVANTGWTYITGAFTATGLGAANGNYLVRFFSTGSIMSEEIIVRRLDDGEV